MRWFFSFLVVLNIVVYFWFQSTGPVEVTEGKPVEAPKGGIKLLNELSDVEKKPLKKQVAVNQPAQVRDQQCGWYGPVPEVVTAKQVAGRIKENGGSSQFVTLPQKRYIVFIGPEKDYQAASKKAAAYRDRKIDAFVIKDGVFANSVQFGAFLKEDNARKRKEELKEKNKINASVRSDSKYLEQTWIVVPLSDYKRFSGDFEKQLLKDFSYMQARKMDCPSK